MIIFVCSSLLFNQIIDIANINILIND